VLLDWPAMAANAASTPVSPVVLAMVNALRERRSTSCTFAPRRTSTARCARAATESAGRAVRERGRRGTRGAGKKRVTSRKRG